MGEVSPWELRVLCWRLWLRTQQFRIMARWFRWLMRAKERDDARVATIRAEMRER